MLKSTKIVSLVKYTSQTLKDHQLFFELNEGGGVEVEFLNTESVIGTQNLISHVRELQHGKLRGNPEV